MTGTTARDDRLKRAFDVVVAGLALLVLTPGLAAIALAVRAESPGPAIFRQVRVGHHGETFRIHKFRTMTLVHDGQGVSPAGDRRVTRIGRVLRRGKLDELPQLLDVLRGRMSLVGPRPELPEFVALWPAAHRDVILSVRPGITDPATISLRREAEELARVPDPRRHYVEHLLPRKAAMYADYVQTRSFLRDLLILARTVVVVVAG